MATDRSVIEDSKSEPVTPQPMPPATNPPVETRHAVAEAERTPRVSGQPTPTAIEPRGVTDFMDTPRADSTHGASVAPIVHPRDGGKH